VIRGEGATVAGDRELAWSRHDSFAVPNWIEHRHINRSRTDEAILFTVNDVPLLLSLGLYREEPESSLGAIERILV
jgi:gentisate 1,2-dioxygenase